MPPRRATFAPRAPIVLPVSISVLLSVSLAGRLAVAGTASDAGFEHKPKPPADRVSLQLEEADLSELVRVVGELTGKRFVIASPKLAKVKASIYAPQKVTIDEAYQAFLAVLTANGLTVVPQAGFYKIVESQDVARQLTPLERGDLPAEERYITRIHRLAHLGAEDVASGLLSKLQTKDASVVAYGDVLIITETSANLRRMLEVLEVVDQAGEEDKLWFRPIRYLPASDIEKQLSAVLGLDKSKAEAGVAGGPLHVARLVALERPNALVVVGTRASYERVAEIVDLVDVAPSNELKVHVVPLQHADAKKVVGPINEALGAAGAPGAAPKTTGAAIPAPMLEASVKVGADENTNALIVSATPRDFIQLREVIRVLDRPKRQVFIEAAILDISAERGSDIGVAWHGGNVHDAMLGSSGEQQTTFGGFRSTTSAMPGAADLQAFALGIRGPEIPFTAIPGITRIPSFGAFLSAVATSKGADILSTPSILASDNTPAELKVQLQTSLQPNAPSYSPYLPTGTGLPTALPTSSNVASNYKGIGPRVKVTPHLNDSDEVRLDVDEVISDIQNAPGPLDTYGTVSYIERTATTTLTVKDGSTVVIGGLVRNRISRDEKKVPFFGDIPILGALFRTRSDRVEKSNLVLVLTPHIVRDESDMRRIFERKMEERQEILDREALFASNEWAAPRDWKKSRGLLAHIRGSDLAVAARRKEADEAAATAEAKRETVPLDLPVPRIHTAASGAAPSAKPASTGGSVSPPVKPNVIER